MEPFYQIEKLGDEFFPVKFFNTSLSEGEYIAPHWHDFLEILYFYEGTAQIQINSGYFDVKPGEAIVLNSLDIHSIYGTANYYVLEFETKLSRDTSISLFRVFPNNDADKIIRTGEPSRRLLDTIEEYMSDIAESYKIQPPGYELDIRGSIYKILAALIRYASVSGFNAGEYEKAKNNLGRLEILLKYIEEHYQEQLTTQKAAEISNYNPSYFCRFFKNIMGRNFLDYLNFYRCLKAQELLNKTVKSITEIAFEVGFGSSNYFNAMYRRYMGYAPTRERNPDRFGCERQISPEEG